MNALTGLNADKTDHTLSPPHTRSVLLVEDDEDVSRLVVQAMTRQGYRIEHCSRGEEGLLKALSGEFQLVLLDIMLPDMDGLTLLSRLRSAGRQLPVIMLSALGEEQDRINGFHSGADDYLPKPFSVTELQLRTEVLLKRCYLLPAREEQTIREEAGIRLLRKEKQLQVQQPDGQWVSPEVTPVEFELLWQLICHRDETLSRPYLYQVVLGRAFSRYDRSLDMHISNLRNKLRRVLPDAGLIRTVRGQGYRYQ